MFSSSLFPIILIIFPSAFEVDVAYFRISTFTILPSFTLSAYFFGIYISGIFLSFKETTNPKFLDFTKVPITNFVLCFKIFKTIPSLVFPSIDGLVILTNTSSPFIAPKESDFEI